MNIEREWGGGGEWSLGFPLFPKKFENYVNRYNRVYNAKTKYNIFIALPPGH